MLPVTNITVLLAKSFFSAFTHLQSEVDELRKNYISSVKLVALVSLPILIPVALISEEFVLIVFGEAWVKMSPFITILCVAGILGSFNGMSDALITSQGQTRLLLKIVVIEKIVFLLLIICGSFYGLIGVAIGKVLSQLFSLLFRTYKQQDILRLSFLSWLSAFRKILLSTAIMILTGILIKDFLFDYSEWMRTFLMGIILNAVFFLSLFVQNESIVFSIIKIVKEKVRLT
jgi:O-antigen/teichoic acid export membrane protein